MLAIPHNIKGQILHNRDNTMGSGHSDYVHGEMNVDDHKDTFGGFMDWTTYGGAMVALIVILPTLIFCTALTWFPALVVTTIVGIILGVALKLKGGWYALVIGLAVLIAIFCLIF